MIFLWIFLAVLFLILALLLTPIHLIFQYPAKSNVSFRIFCFRFDGAELFKKIFLKDEELSAEASKSNRKPKKKKGKSSADLLGFVDFLIHLTDVICESILEFLSKAKVDLKELKISIGSDDAAKTALLTTGVHQAANVLCAVLHRFSKFRCNSKKMMISSDFLSEKSDFSLHLDISCTVIHIIRVYLHTNMRFFN